MSCRDLITLEARVWLLRNGQCAILMTGCIVERSVNLRMYNIVVEFYVRGEEFANHVFLFIVGIVSFFVS
jgi:late competence protein required for DNA uptake (superfamily II DNA/RNA helicase)